MSSLNHPIQPAVEQDHGFAEEGSSLAVVSKSLLLRQSIARKLAVVGIEVFEYQHFDNLFQSNEVRQPDIVLIDTAEQELNWRALVSLLKIFSERSRVVLLASSVNVEQAVEAAESGVAAIFIKPFKAEQHTERILDLLQETQKIAPKRLQPRFTPQAESAVHVDYLPADDWLAFPMGVGNISQKGAKLRLPYGEYAGELQPGSSGFPATLAIGTSRISLQLSVVHREGVTIGVVFDGLGAGGKILDAFIREMTTRAFGDGGNHRTW